MVVNYRVVCTGENHGLYGPGMSYRDISSYNKEMYDATDISTRLSQITDQINPDIKAWLRRS